MNRGIIPIDIRCLQKVGGQLGTNPAGVYMDDAGQKYYVKILESPMHARNEFIAAKLYQLAQAPVFDYLPSVDPCQIVTRWVELDKKRIVRFSPEERRQAQQGLAVHAWTANWDAAGYDGDNQGVVNGTVLTLDVGGALSYRAHGDPKGKAFGVSVDELNVLRSDPDNPHAVKLFSDMTNPQIRTSIEVVTSLCDTAIREVIMEHGGSHKLADKMIARKQDMIIRLNQL
jgi:hypothetical protein